MSTRRCKGVCEDISYPLASELRSDLLSSGVILPIIVTKIGIKAQTARSHFGGQPSSFKVRTVSTTAGTSIRSLNLGFERGSHFPSNDGIVRTDHRGRGRSKLGIFVPPKFSASLNL